MQVNPSSLDRPELDQQVFVYGSLKTGMELHSNITRFDHRLLGRTTIKGLMFHLSHYPAICVDRDFQNTIRGEVFSTSWAGIKWLDRVEGVPGFYQRIQIRLDKGFPKDHAWAYVFPYEKAKLQEWLVPAGVWYGPETPKIKWFGDQSIVPSDGSPPRHKIVLDADTNEKLLIDIKSGEVLHRLDRKEDEDALSHAIRSLMSATKASKTIYLPPPLKGVVVESKGPSGTETHSPFQCGPGWEAA